jgi:hypothetical protein
MSDGPITSELTKRAPISIPTWLKWVIAALTGFGAAMGTNAALELRVLHTEQAIEVNSKKHDKADAERAAIRQAQAVEKSERENDSEMIKEIRTDIKELMKR